VHAGPPLRIVNVWRTWGGYPDF